MANYLLNFLLATIVNRYRISDFSSQRPLAHNYIQQLNGFIYLQKVKANPYLINMSPIALSDRQEPIVPNMIAN